MIDKMRSVLRRVWLTTKIVLLLVALMALCIWFAEPFGWVWRTASALALGMMWAIVYKLLPRGSATLPRRAHYPETHVGLVAPQPRFGKPPKSARYTWTLTEGGVPVGVEYDRRAVDNWIALGEDHDAIAHKLN